MIDPFGQPEEKSNLYDNKVELIGVYGSDETHALSAWTSTSRELTDEKRARIPKLLKMLVEGSDGNSHGTPFEKSSLHFLVTSDIASHIHALKHRIGVSINCQSARYQELKEDIFYVPSDWPLELQKALIEHTESSINKYHDTLRKLVDSGMDRKRAKESARFFLPYATQLTWDVMFNFRSFMHFVALRNSPSAQKEIREIAESMLNLVKETGKFTYSLEAFGY
jgi:thymidylate synthase (FAD)